MDETQKLHTSLPPRTPYRNWIVDLDTSLHTATHFFALFLVVDWTYHGHGAEQYGSSSALMLDVNRALLESVVLLELHFERGFPMTDLPG